MRKFKVLLTHPLPAEWLTSVDDQVEWLIGPDEMMGIAPEVMPFLPEVDGILSFLCDRVSEEHLAMAKNLKVISNYAAGTDNIAVAACTARGIPVGNTPGALTDATADLTLALILTIIRQLPQAAESARQGDWKMWYAARWLGQSLKGAKLGVVGMGKIGSAVARRARSFGMDIIYSSRSSKEEIEQELGAVRMDTEELLAACDIVTLHAPLTPETRHLINERTLQLMKPTAVLINTARGAEVDTDALYQALRFGRIYAAGLDVTDPEPLPADHPLYTLPNCVILPHIGSATTTARKIMAEMACANLMAGLTGTDLPNCANPGYRRIS